MHKFYNNIQNGLLNHRFIFGVEEAGAKETQQAQPEATDDFLKFLDNQPSMEEIQARSQERTDETKKEGHEAGTPLVELGTELNGQQTMNELYGKAKKMLTPKQQEQYKEHLTPGDNLQASLVNLQVIAEEVPEIAKLLEDRGLPIEQKVTKIETRTIVGSKAATEEGKRYAAKQAAEAPKDDALLKLAQKLEQGATATTEIVSMKIEDGKTLEKTVYAALDNPETKKVLGEELALKVKQVLTEMNAELGKEIQRLKEDDYFLPIAMSKHIKYNQKVAKNLEKVVRGSMSAATEKEVAAAGLARGSLNAMMVLPIDTLSS